MWFLYYYYDETRVEMHAISRGKHENNGFFRDNWAVNVRIRHL